MAEICELLNLKGPSYSCELRAFLSSLDISTDMIELGAKTTDQRAFVSKQVNMQRMSNNPVALTDAQISSVFEL